VSGYLFGWPDAEELTERCINALDCWDFPTGFGGYGGLRK